jgi:hypothetical protein
MLLLHNYNLKLDLKDYKYKEAEFFTCVAFL